MNGQGIRSAPLSARTRRGVEGEHTVRKWIVLRHRRRLSQTQASMFLIYISPRSQSSPTTMTSNDPKAAQEQVGENADSPISTVIQTSETNGSKGTNGTTAIPVSVSDLPPEALDLATRLFNAARKGECEVFQQVLSYNPRVKDLRNDRGDTLVCFSSHDRFSDPASSSTEASR